ncbi:hypothetical protein [Geomicrobium sp. JCM 19038]|uniref:hypothetical protein n=1 Tax=Geomicrobium sp. JCM 19038 TaxID=1460635 RepID=UPI001EE63EAC|nr:hypothetical protein [Geomicrobium sp. JCM 19038]
MINQHTITRYEETEKLKRQGVLLTGPVEAVKSMIGTSNVLEERKIGKQLHVMIDDDYDDSLITRTEATGIKIEKAPLQDYLVNLTKKGTTKV